MKKIEVVLLYLKILENFSSSQEDFLKVLHPEVIQIEYPNTLNKNGQERGFEGMRQGSEMGRKILRSQKFEIKNSIEQNEKLMVEATWLGIIANDMGPFKKDQALKAFFCMVFDFKDGKIFRQRNYDCFEPWV